MLISTGPDVMRLLADPLRARIVELLADGPACTCHLVADTGAKQPNVSGHRRLLREAGPAAPPREARVLGVPADGPAFPSPLVPAPGAKQPNVSGHLRLLREAGLVAA